MKHLLRRTLVLSVRWPGILHKTLVYLRLQMPNNITYQHCPVCNSSHIQPALKARDYTVSQEIFEIWECRDCTLRFTQHVPDSEHIGPYYQSAAYVSHSDTREGLINNLYHRVRSHTLQEKRKTIEAYTNLKQGALLDVGAGTGAFSHTMQQAGWLVTGLEPDSTARANAREKHRLNLLPPQELYELPAAGFDAITLWHVLEHVHDLQGYMQRFFTLLKPGGRLFIAVPNYTSKDAARYNAHWAAYDVPRHLYHFSPASIQQLAAIHGFEVAKHLPMWFDSFYVSMLSEQYKNGKGNLPAAFFSGIASNLTAWKDVTKCSSVVYVLRKKQ
jgi:SAM-dependent methyltransferase